MLKESNNPCRLIASLLSSTFFLTALAASNARAEDLPLDSPHFGAEASGTSVAVALANAAQQIIDGSAPSSESTLVMTEPGTQLNLSTPSIRILISIGNIAVSTSPTLHYR